MEMYLFWRDCCSLVLVVLDVRHGENVFFENWSQQ